MNGYHVVRKGDTLGKIAKQYKTTITELRKLNELRDPNKLAIGQRIALRKEYVCGFETLFLDADRNPIKGLEYVLDFCGKSVRGATGENGMAQKIITDAPTDMVRILVKRFDGTMKEIASTVSGYRNKLATLVSPLLVVETQLKPHPKETRHAGEKTAVRPVYGRDHLPEPPAGKRGPGLKTKQAATVDGKAVTLVEGDLVMLDEFLDKYVGGALTQDEIENASRELKCDPGLIYAIARQESGSSSFINLGGRMVPKVLYERHWFKRLTRTNKLSPSPYESKYPDICGPAYRRVKKNKEGKLIDQSTYEIITSIQDTYGPEGAYQYKRLVKAYQLNPDAALQSCSWGKFQIMGFNYKTAGFATVKSFTKAMSRSDHEHFKAFLKFANGNSVLLEALRKKDFEKIAEGHNGKNWRTLNAHYATNLRNYYDEYQKRDL